MSEPGARAIVALADPIQRVAVPTNAIAEDPRRRRIDRDRALLLIVDVQQRLAPHVRDHQAIVARCEALIAAAAAFDLPVFATEHVPDHIGPLLPQLAARVDASCVMRKSGFSAAGDGDFVARLRSTGRSQIVVAGMETHVCVLQSALGLLDVGFEVFVAADAVASRPERDADRAFALQRLASAGCIVAGTETVLFEWMRDAADPRFAEILRLVKALPASRQDGAA